MIRSVKSGLFAKARSSAVIAPVVNPVVPIVQAGSNPSTPSGGAPDAPLPNYADAGVPKITISKPAGTTAAYTVTYSLGGAAKVTAGSFPFTITPANATQTFTLTANDDGCNTSPQDTESWDSLFL